MSFGFSISDFITAIELANRVRKEFIGAPSQFKAISDEVRSLSIVLQDVEVLSEQELDDQQKTDLKDIAGSCQRVLHELQETLDNYGELVSRQKSIGKTAKRAWKRLTWEPDNICELRNRITSNVTLLNSFSEQCTRGNVVKLVRRQYHQEHREILDWLTPIDYAPQHNDFISRRQPGTGQWLLDSAEYRTWLKTNTQTLFCPGIPGAGKTILTSIVVDDLCNRFHDDAAIGIAYVYCDFRRKEEQKIDNLLLSLLKQLAQSRPFLPESVRDLYDRHNERRIRPSLDEISRTLHSSAVLCSRVFIIVDALDECQLSDGCRATFLSEIFSLQAKCHVNIFATSRSIPDIMERFKEGVTLEIRACDKDVRNYLEGQISQSGSNFLKKYHKEIQDEIAKVVDGMFLLAQLHFDSIKTKKTIKKVKDALKCLPTGSEAYSRAYEDAMDRIRGQDADSRELAQNVLSWIVCAKRPLTTSELQHALAVEPDAPELDKENLLQVEDMVSVCAGLVTIDKESGIIRLVHYTTQEYFVETQRYWFPDAEVIVTKTCITYLSFDDFETGFCPTDKDFEMRLRLNPLYDYAARNWGHHARAASVKVKELVLTFLESGMKISAASQAAMVSRGPPGYSQRVPQQRMRLHLAAYFGLSEVVKTLLISGYEPNLKDSYEQTPLLLAAWNGHYEVVSLLLSSNVDVNCEDKDGRTPVSWAAEMGHERVVKTLLKKKEIRPYSKDKYELTPLTWAEVSGHTAVANLLSRNDHGNSTIKNTSSSSTFLLRATKDGNEVAVTSLLRDIDPNSKDESGRTALSWAAEKGYETVIKLLLATGNVDVNFNDEYGRTPLAFAVMYEHEAITKLLLKADGAELNCKDKYGVTPLVQAVWRANDAIVKLLLEHGARSDSQDALGRTPLWYAASGGCKAIVELLLEKNITEANRKDVDGFTPLLCAADRGHVDVVKLFLEKGIRAELDTNDDKTWLQYAIDVVELLLEDDKVEASLKYEHSQVLLSQAAQRGHVAITKLLLDRDHHDNLTDNDNATLHSYSEGVIKLLLEPCNIYADSKDEHGRALLSYAAEKGHEAMVKLLLDKGADFKSKDTYGQTPLSWAAENGHEAVVKLLLDKGANFKSNDMDGRTLLSNAVEKGYEAMVKLLLDKGADIESKDMGGRTMLSWAAEKGNEAMVKLLLYKGAGFESKDMLSRTPLSYAAEKGHKAIVKLLLDNGADFESEDTYGQTPLSYTAKKGHEAIVKLLLDKGANFKSKDTYGRNPLSYAAENGHEAVVELLLDKGADFKSKDTYGRTLLSYAAEDGHEAMVKLLLNKGADIESKDTLFDRTPLSWAAENCHEAVVKLLLDKGAESKPKQ